MFARANELFVAYYANERDMISLQQFSGRNVFWVQKTVLNELMWTWKVKKILFHRQKLYFYVKFLVYMLFDWFQLWLLWWGWEMAANETARSGELIAFSPPTMSTSRFKWIKLKFPNDELRHHRQHKNPR